MGVIADAIMAYAQPLIDLTDGSLEQVEKAMAIAVLCYNMALAPESERNQMLDAVRPTLHMDDDEFAGFRRSIIDPMILRHQEMFPRMHGLSPAASPRIPSPPVQSKAAAGEAYPGTDVYAPCPCQSGRKYKFCCRKKGR